MTSSLNGRPRNPILFVLSGPSGVGKNSVIQRLRPLFPRLYSAVTATTRPPRRGEREGIDYFFLSREQYDSLLDQGELLAPAEVHGNWYGAPIQAIRAAFERDQDVLLTIDVQGAIGVRRRLPQAVFIFLAPPSLDDLKERLLHRHTETPAQLERRLRAVDFEMAQMPFYDYAVVNGDLETAVHEIGCIISAERLRLHRQSIDLTPR